MRKHRLLVQDAWYEVRTVINNREPLSRRRQAIAIFCRMFGVARERFAFELRGFALVEERLSFLSVGRRVAAPGDHAVVEANILGSLQSAWREIRARLGRPVLVGVLEGEPPEEAGEVDWDVAAETGEISFGTWPPDVVSPLMAENPANPDFRPKTPPDPRLRPAKRPHPPHTRPKTAREHRRNHPPQDRQTTAPVEIRPILNPEAHLWCDRLFKKQTPMPCSSTNRAVHRGNKMCIIQIYAAINRFAYDIDFLCAQIEFPRY
jgi:hypothetical protein